MSFVTRSYPIYYRFRVKDLYSERELEDLLETLERRGGHYTHMDEGWYEIAIPPELLWMPFYKTIKECNSTEQLALVAPSEAKHPRPIGISEQTE